MIVSVTNRPKGLRQPRSHVISKTFGQNLFASWAATNSGIFQTSIRLILRNQLGEEVGFGPTTIIAPGQTITTSLTWSASGLSEDPLPYALEYREQGGLYSPIGTPFAIHNFTVQALI